MCLQCHSALGDKDVVASFKETRVRNFEEWNTTSLSHCALAASGMNGLEARALALDVLDAFVEWYAANKTDRYVPKNGLELMYPIDEIRTLAAFLKGLTAEQVAVAKGAFNHPTETSPSEQAFLDEFNEKFPKTTEMVKFVNRNDRKDQLPAVSGILIGAGIGTVIGVAVGTALGILLRSCFGHGR